MPKFSGLVIQCNYYICFIFISSTIFSAGDYKCNKFTRAFDFN